jgi:hypothetical protein
MDDTWVVFALWTAAALLLGWTWIPALIAGLGGSRYSNGGAEDLMALDPMPGEPDYAYWHQKITALGYEPLGPAWMRIRFHGSDWHYEFRVRVFYSRSKKAYAFVQRQPSPMNVWCLVMFATVFAEDKLLLTSNTMNESAQDEAYMIQGLESENLAAVEEMHLAHCDRLKHSGHRPDPEGTLETLLQSMQKHAGPAGRYVGMKLGQTYLATHVPIHAFLTLPVAYISGIGHWSVPLVNLTLGLMLAMSERVAKRRAGVMMREQVMARAGGKGDRPI